MKYVLGALAAVTLLIGVAVSQPAEARCWWNGWTWHCWHRHHYWYPGYYGYAHPRAYWWGGY